MPNHSWKLATCCGRLFQSRAREEAVWFRPQDRSPTGAALFVITLPTHGAGTIFHLMLLLVGLAAVAAPAQTAANEPDETSSAATSAAPERINRLIEDLGDQSYAVRTAATLELCRVGVAARSALAKAAAERDAETALRAQRILNILDQLLFLGTDLKLSFSKERIAWDEPVNLRLEIVNPSQYAARVPFELSQPTTNHLSTDARQVGNMLDIADWLHVRREDGSIVRLRIDDISMDSDVLAAVQHRLDGDPTSLVPPGKTATIELRAFSRGWARYPLLDAGTYSVWVDYVPEWEDDALARDRVGRVTSTRATITVTAAAPETVSRNGEVASLTLSRSGAKLVAALTNHTDQPLVINANIGAAVPFATAHWILREGDQVIEIPATVNRTISWKAFAPSNLLRVLPGKATEIAQIDIAELAQRCQAIEDTPQWKQPTIRFSYTNQCDRAWQQRRGSALRDDEQAPPALRQPLPRRMLTTRLKSNEVILPDFPRMNDR